MRFLATWELGLGYGHIANLAPIGAELRRRGHTVVLAARDPEAARTSAGREAFDQILPCPTSTVPAPTGETLIYGQVIAAGGFVDTASVAWLIGKWLSLFDLVGPDALLVEHAPVSLLAAHVAGIPAIRLGPSFTAPMPRRSMASLLPWAAQDEVALAAASVRADRIVREICAMFAVPVLDGLSGLLDQAPGFALTWPELDHHGPDPAATYYGPLGGVTGNARPAWPTSQGPRTLVYLRFDRPAGRKVAMALGELGWPVIWHAAAAPCFPLADNIHFSRAMLDLEATASEADLFVGRGSHGASCVMVQRGVPQLLLPDTLESLLLTWRLRHAGLARSQSYDVGVAQVRAGLEVAAQDPALARTARHVGDRLSGYSAAEAIRLLTDDIFDCLNVVQQNRAIAQP